MEVELFVHGVPNGESFWGKEEDRSYFSTFYDKSADEVKFLVQTCSRKEKAYCYYNYLVYKTIGAQTPNVVANDGRPGSYFGMTLRLDAYCKDIVNMYRILDTIYNVYVMGNLLKMEKAKLKYTIPDFASASSTLESIEKAAIELIRNAFSGDSFIQLDGFAMSGGNYPVCNLYDCTPESVMAAVKQYSRIAISPYYPSGKEAAIQQQCDAQIQAIQQQCDARLKADADARAKEKSELGQKNGTISQLNSEVLRLKSEIQNMGQGKKVAQVVAPIREPIMELATILKRIAPESSEHHTKQKDDFDFSMVKTFKSLIPFLNLILLLIIVAILLNPFKGTENKYSDSDALEVKIEALKKENQDLKAQLHNTKVEQIQKTAGYSVGQDEDETEIAIPVTPAFDINSVIIDVQGYPANVKPLKKNDIYTVVAVNGSINDGSWQVEGCEKYPTRNPNMIRIMPTADIVNISYYVGDKHKDRVLTAQ